MISNEASLIRAKASEAAALACAIEEFLARGGEIVDLQPKTQLPKPEPRPYGRNHEARKPKPAKQLRPEKTPCPQITALAEAKEKARIESQRRVQDLAKSMTLAEVIRETGISKYNLRRMAASGGFQFQRYNPSAHLKPNSTDRINDAMNVVRIKNARDCGLSRHEASVDLKISWALMKRLITEYAIDYPKHKPGRK